MTVMSRDNWAFGAQSHYRGRHTRNYNPDFRQPGEQRIS